jgi:hypothetical protein
LSRPGKIAFHAIEKLPIRKRDSKWKRIDYGVRHALADMSIALKAAVRTDHQYQVASIRHRRIRGAVIQRECRNEQECNEMRYGTTISV